MIRTIAISIVATILSLYIYKRFFKSKCSCGGHSTDIQAERA